MIKSSAQHVLFVIFATLISHSSISFSQDLRIFPNAKKTIFKSYFYNIDDLTSLDLNENSTWDFSNIRIEDSTDIRAISPAKGTPFETAYPKANIVIIRENGESYNYFNLSRDSLVQLGDAQLDKSEINHINATRYVYPMYLHQQFENIDTFIVNKNNSPNSDSSVQILNGKTYVDTQGTLILPNFPPTKALRLRLITEQKSKFYLKGKLKGYSIFKALRYQWHTNEMLFPELFIYQIDTIRYYRHDGTFLKEMTNRDIAGNVPMINSGLDFQFHSLNMKIIQGSLSFSTAVLSDINLKIFSSSGQNIFEKKYPASQFTKGVNKINLSALSLANGLYIVVLSNNNKSQALKWIKK